MILYPKPINESDNGAEGAYLNTGNLSTKERSLDGYDMTKGEYAPKTGKMEKLFSVLREILKHGKNIGITVGVGKDSEFVKRMTGKDNWELDIVEYGVSAKRLEWKMDNRWGDVLDLEWKGIWSWDVVSGNEELVDGLIKVAEKHLKSGRYRWFAERCEKSLKDAVGELSKIGVWNDGYQISEFVKNILPGIETKSGSLSVFLRTENDREILCLAADPETCSSWKGFDLKAALAEKFKKTEHLFKDFRKMESFGLFVYNDFKSEKLDMSETDKLPVNMWRLTLVPFEDGTYMRTDSPKAVKITKKTAPVDGMQAYQVKIGEFPVFMEMCLIIEDFYDGDVPDETVPYTMNGGNGRFLVKDRIVIRDRELAERIMVSMFGFRRFVWSDNGIVVSLH